MQRSLSMSGVFLLALLVQACGSPASEGTPLQSLRAGALFSSQEGQNLNKVIEELFQKNQTLASQGFFTAEFEFKIMGVVLRLNQNDSEGAAQLVEIVKEQYDTRSLPRIPVRIENEKEADYLVRLVNFYLERQDPETGAFMDSRFPWQTYLGTTLNVIDTLRELQQRIETITKQRQPLVLKHSLKFLDHMNTPRKLFASQNELVLVNKSVANLPKTPFILAQDAKSLLNEFSDVFVRTSDEGGISPAFLCSPELESAIYTSMALG